MRIPIFALASALLLAGSPLAGFPQETVAPEARTPAPRIACDQPVYEFGEVDSTKVVEHTFVIRNDGDVSLEILGVRATCGCTATDVSTRFIAPGETAEIKAKLNLQGRQGRQRKAIMVQSNDPQNPTLTLYFDGTALMAVQANPRQIFFGRITPEAVVTGVVDLVFAGQRPINLLKVESSSPLFSVTNVPVKERAAQQIFVQTVPPLPNGAVRGNVRIETDHPTYPVVDIGVSGFIVGHLTFAPNEVVLPEKPDGAETRYLLCRAEGDTPFEIVSVQMPDPAMEAKIQATAPSAYRIEIRNIRPTMELNGQAIRVITTLEDPKEFSVPLRVVPQAERPVPPS